MSCNLCNDLARWVNPAGVGPQELFPDYLRASGRALRDRSSMQATLRGWLGKKGAYGDERTQEDAAALEVRICGSCFLLIYFMNSNIFPSGCATPIFLVRRGAIVSGPKCIESLSKWGWGWVLPFYFCSSTDRHLLELDGLPWPIMSCSVSDGTIEDLGHRIWGKCPKTS